MGASYNYGLETNCLWNSVNLGTIDLGAFCEMSNALFTAVKDYKAFQLHENDPHFKQLVEKQNFC